jgi:hypothetical protein
VPCTGDWGEHDARTLGSSATGTRFDKHPLDRTAPEVLGDEPRAKSGLVTLDSSLDLLWARTAASGLTP